MRSQELTEPCPMTLSRLTIRIAAETPWYELFSRGARDWLRHNQKVREAVKDSLPDLLAGSDLITRPATAPCRCRCKFLEHARFRLLDPQTGQGAGQGKGEPGDVLQPGQARKAPSPGEGGGTGNGEIQFVLELKVDEIVDWLWEELKLPDSSPSARRTMDEPDFVREGWDKRGARSRLDRRTHVKEAVKRRAIQSDPVPFTDDDLRFRQLREARHAGDQRRGDLRARRLGQHGRGASAASPRVLLLRAAGHPPAVQQGRDRCSSRTPARRGSSTRASSSRPPRAAAR